jgi:hypothetical protein
LGVSTTLLQVVSGGGTASQTVKLLSNATCSVGENVWFNWITSGTAYGNNWLINTVSADGQTIGITYAGVSGDTPYATALPAGAYVSVGHGNLSFPLSFANGGTSAATQAAALTALLASSTVPVANGGTGAATAILGLNGLGIGYTPTSSYGSGTVYTMTASTQRLNIGTNVPSIVIPRAGTYLIFGSANFAYAGATYSVYGHYLTMKLRDTSAGTDLTGTTTTPTSAVQGFPPLTTITAPAFSLSLWGIYTGSTDVIELWGNVDALPGAGTVTCTATSIIAVKIY